MQPPPHKLHRRSISSTSAPQSSSSSSSSMSSMSSSSSNPHKLPAPPPPLPAALGYHFPPLPPPLFNPDLSQLPAPPPPLVSNYAAPQDFLLRSMGTANPQHLQSQQQHPANIGKFQPSASLPPPSPSLSPSPSPAPFNFGAPDRERASSYNAVNPAPRQPSEQKLKRRSRSFTDLSEMGKQQLQQQFNPSFNFVYPGFQPFPLPMQMQPGQPFPEPFAWQPLPMTMLPPMVNGKVAISRAPEGISGKPVHIVTQQEKKQAHSAMERRYRKELNSQISLLKEVVPSCRSHSGSNINKVLILKKTVEYVRALRLRENDLINPSRVEDPEIFLAAPDLGENTAMAEKIVAQRILIDQQQQIIEHLSRDYLLLIRGDPDPDQDDELEGETPEHLHGGQSSDALEDFGSEGFSQFSTTTTTLLNDQVNPVLPPPHHPSLYQSPQGHYTLGGFGGQQFEGDLTNIRNEFGNVALTEQQLRGLP